MQHQKSGNKKKAATKKTIDNSKLTRNEIKELKKIQKQEKLLQKAKKKYGVTEKNTTDNKIIEKENINKDSSKDNELSERLSKLSKEQQDALLKLLER